MKVTPNNPRIIELISLLKNKKTTSNEFEKFGWLIDKDMDVELLTLLVSHPNSPVSTFSRSIGLAIKLPDSDFKKVMLSLLNNKPRFMFSIWSTITMSGIDKKYNAKFLSNMADILQEHTDLLNPIYIGLIFNETICSNSGVYADVTPEYIRFTTALLDNPNIIIHDIFADLFKEAPQLKIQNVLSKTQDGKIFEAILASKNASKILDMMYELTGNNYYLPKLSQDLFLW